MDLWCILIIDQEEAVTLVKNMATDGLPYICPNSNVDFSDSGHIYIENMKLFQGLPGANYRSGICFSAENSSCFALNRFS